MVESNSNATKLFHQNLKKSQKRYQMYIDQSHKAADINDIAKMNNHVTRLTNTLKHYN